jgi:acyl carrier protein
MEIDMENKLKDICATIFEIDASIINNDSSPDNIESWDSMNHMNLILAIEEEFQLKILDDDAVELLSFLELLFYLKKQKA